MRSNKWMLIGSSVVAAGVLMLGLAYAASGVVHAGNKVPCDATPFVPTATPDLRVFSQQTPECTATPTPQRKLKTQTPTATNTETPKTATPVPPTVAPTNTPKPSAGNEGVAVKPPNTGSGGGAPGGTDWFMGLGALLVLLGGGAALVGVKQRR